MTPLFEIIRCEVAQHGVLPFARFMELALYCPKHGYYEAKKDNPGRSGDFYTSVGTGELFGRLLARQFAGWLAETKTFPPQRSTFSLVEGGAHDGKLARDILGWLQRQRPELFGRIEYCIIEPSAQRQEWQRETLKDFVPRVRWFDRFVQNSKFNGIIFSNELLDAMPVHRFGWDAAKKAWFEWGVTLADEKFVWARIQPSTFSLQPSPLESVLPDGYTIETSPAAEAWWREAAGVLEHGKLMTMDYGLTADEIFSPGRLNGTLRAYFRHHTSNDLLANVGEQDLTAHVNFSAIQAAGESAGLKTEAFQTQSQFLTRILEKASQENSLEEFAPSKLDGSGNQAGWTSALTRQFQTLTHPEHLGRAFRVLVQARQDKEFSTSRREVFTQPLR
jgi:SAM-dependent MidA family methyltransferase